MGRASSGRLAPPKPPAPPSGGNPGGFTPGDNASPNKVFEQAFQRGKAGPEDTSLFSRLRQGVPQYIRETFIPQHLLKGADLVRQGVTRSKFYARAIDRIRTLHPLNRDRRRQAQEITGAIFKNLTRDEYDLVNRYLFARDAHENVLRGIEHRPGFDAGSVSDELNRLTDLVKQNPDVQLAIDSYKQLMNGVADQLIREGLLSAENPREWYYPHMVVDFLDEVPGEKTLFGLRRPRVRTGGGVRYREPGSLKKREGSVRDINTNLINTMERYLTDVLVQVEKRKTLNEIGKMYDIRHNPKEGAVLGEGNQEPPGYKEWDPSLGFARFRAGSVAERYLGEMIDFGGLDKLAEHYGVDKVEFRKMLEGIGITDPEALAKKLGASVAAENAGPKYIIPEELAQTLDSAIDQMNKAELRGLTEQGVRFWKTLVLNAAPVRYNFRNLVGDVERMYVQFGQDAFDAKMWRDVTQSVVNYYRHGTIDPLIQDMLDGGITSSTRIQSEYALSDVNPHLRHLEHGLDTSNLKRAASSIWRFMKVIPETSAAREDIMRGVLVEMNKRRLAQGKEMLSGVADQEIVKGLTEHGEARRAHNYIARKALLDYGDFTPRENKWRNGAFPFYAWASGNFTFWGALGKRALKGGSKDALARGSATAALKGIAVAGVVLGSIRAWNDLVMGEYEEQLPTNIRKTSHFIVPDFEHWQETGEFRPVYDEEGKALVWQTADALDDFLTWLGLDTAVPEAMSVIRGTLTKDEYLKRQREHAGWGKGAARAFLNQIGPREQLLVQGVLGKRLFPNPLSPSDIPIEQRASAMRDVFGLSALPGVEGVVGAAHPGGDVFQPTTKAYDVFKQLGFKYVQEPTVFMEGNLQKPSPRNVTVYEADLIKRIQQKQYELRDLIGRMKREVSEQSNRQLTQEDRQKAFTQRMLKHQELVAELKQLATRYQDLTRTKRFQSTNPF